MKEDFLELTEYLDGKFTEVDRQFKEMKEDFVNLQSSIDVYAKKADAFFE